MIKSDVEYCKILQNYVRMFGIGKMNNLQTWNLKIEKIHNSTNSSSDCSARCHVSVSFQTFLQAQVFQRNANVAERLRSWSTTSSKVRHSANKKKNAFFDFKIKKKEYVLYNMYDINMYVYII